MTENEARDLKRRQVKSKEMRKEKHKGDRARKR